MTDVDAVREHLIERGFSVKTDEVECEYAEKMYLIGLDLMLTFTVDFPAHGVGWRLGADAQRVESAKDLERLGEICDEVEEEVKLLTERFPWVTARFRASYNNQGV